MMTSLRGLGPPGDNHRHAMWDAAYVLGSLSATDWREFEAHMAGCPECRLAVAELSGIPAMLAQLDRSDIGAINEADHPSGATEMPPELLPSLLAAACSRRARSRVMTWMGSAAAAVILTIGVLVGVHGSFPTAPPQAAVSALPMDQVGTTLLASTVSLSGQQWGTNIALKFVCLAPPDAPHDTVALVVVGRDGSQTRLATWVAIPGHTATPTGSVSMPADQIATVQVVLADNGHVMLQRSI
ncbi:zf-HC2 domain-containing protein [Mycobacterium intracellulare]|uniref:anti-sigma factor family protein n=1 Tax=Mycobacterium intracellulare TaxID=1767 RepID=UPI001CD9CAEA|nr:zf-HC2 domain-containing protein [Mycobacterium intracellulare]MCA2306043.1 zf-HC2 domain-containing protein [Mycobacterium intracellulare]MCA2348270.1 zf-HC2 domain-containing protein [Mycobacterium intracellulare]